MRRHARAAALSGLNHTTAADLFGAFAHGRQAHSGANVGGQAAPVVPDLQSQILFLGIDVHRDDARCRLRVPGHIRQRLLDDAIGRNFDGGRQRRQGLQRLVWTGSTPFEVLAMRATPGGFLLELTEEATR